MGAGRGPTRAAGGLGARVPEDVAALPSFRAPASRRLLRVASPPFRGGRPAFPPRAIFPSLLAPQWNPTDSHCAARRGCETRQLKPGDPGRGAESRAVHCRGRFPPGTQTTWPQRQALVWWPASSRQRPRSARAGAAFASGWGPPIPRASWRSSLREGKGCKGGCLGIRLSRRVQMEAPVYMSARPVSLPPHFSLLLPGDLRTPAARS